MRSIFFICIITVVSANPPAPVPLSPSQVQVVQVQEVQQTPRPIVLPPFPTLPPMRPIVLPTIPPLPAVPALPPLPTLPPIPIVPPIIPQIFHVVTDGLTKVGQALGRPGGIFPLVNLSATPGGVSVTSAGNGAVAAVNGRRKRRFAVRRRC